MHTGNLHEIVILLIAAIFIVALFKRLNLSPVLGYLVAGGAIGPYGLSIIRNVETTAYIAEFGVVFLLFYIGLELTLDRLKSMRVQVFGFGSLQVAITGGLIGYIAYSNGISTDAAIIIGGGLALSSTAIVMQVLYERGEQSTQVGRLSLATLILQDLAVVPLLILVPLLANAESDLGIVIAEAMLKALLALVAIFIIGRLLLKPLYQAIGSLKSEELFMATTLLIVLGSSWTSAYFGLSLALGAFVAGLLVAETEFRHQVAVDIRPFKGLLLGLFFMTVGMSIDFQLLLDKMGIILQLALALLIGKALIITTLSRLFRFRLGPALNAGMVLAQGGEFAFVLFTFATQQQVMEKELSQILLVVVTLTMAVTPAMFVLGKHLANKLQRRQPEELELKDISKETLDLEGHIIVAGFGRVGKTICKLLAVEGINFIALDTDPKLVHEGRKEGFPVYYGDADRMDILKSLGIERADSTIITIRDKKDSLKAVQAIRKAFPNMPIIARAKDRLVAKDLMSNGATLAVAEAFESSLVLGNYILQHCGIADMEIERVLARFRAEEYPNELHFESRLIATDQEETVPKES